MPFNSLKYFLFLPVVYLVFFFVGERARWGVLLAASLLFYAALDVPYLLVVLFLVAITTYSFGIWLDRADTPKTKRALVWGGITANILILVVMKYLPFLSENLKALSEILSLDDKIQPVKAFVAIGVSYYIFQAISYLADIYLEIEKPERHFGYFVLYLAFFPKLLQGPIERAGDLIPQLKTRYEFNYENMRFGLLLFTWGLFKKVVIADRLGLYVDAVYNDVHAFSGLPLLLTTYAYSLPDLHGFLRLHGHGAWKCAFVQHQSDPEFQQPLHCDIGNRFLAALAYQLFTLDPRLHFQAAADAVAQLEKPGYCRSAPCHISRFRDLARCKLGIRDLGRVTWSVHGLFGFV